MILDVKNILRSFLLLIFPLILQTKRPYIKEIVMKTKLRNLFQSEEFKIDSAQRTSDKPYSEAVDG